MTAAKSKAEPEIASPERDHERLFPNVVPEEWEFETVALESPTKVLFDTIGEAFLGKYQGKEIITPDNGDDDPFTLHVFEGRDGIRYAINSGYKLDRALADAHVGRWVKITYVQDIGVTKGNPMKDFRVEVRKA